MGIEKYINLELDQNKDKLIIISPSLASCEGISDLYPEMDTVIITAEIQQHMPKNTIVINPYFNNIKKDASYVFRNEFADQEPFHKLISKDYWFRLFLQNLASSKHETFVKPITMTQDLKLNLPGIKMIGPLPNAAVYHNNKINQRRILSNKIPMADGGIYNKNSLENAVSDLDKGNGVYLAAPFGGGGATVRHIKKDELSEISDVLKNAEEFVVNTWMDDITCSPSVTGIIGLNGEVTVFEPVAQILKNGSIWKASKYPLNEPDKEMINSLKSITKKVGQIMYASNPGFRGYFGTDYIVSGGQVLFVETNARFNAATSENSFAYQSNGNCNNLTVLEKELNSFIGKNGISREYATPKLSWCKERVKLEHDCRIEKEFDQVSMKDLFKNKGIAYFNTHGKGTIIPAGETISTVVSVSDNLDAQDLCEQAVSELKESLARSL